MNRKQGLIAIGFCVGLFLGGEVSAETVKYSLEKSSYPFHISVGTGWSITSTEISGQRKLNSTGGASNIEFFYHLSPMFYPGIGLMERSFNTQAGRYNYRGLSGVLGYFSRADDSSRLGWHGFIGAGFGPVSGEVEYGYVKDPENKYAFHQEAAIGLDYPIFSVSFGSGRLSTININVDLKYERLSYKVTDAGNNRLGVNTTLYLFQVGLSL